jgi:hypothetical protein
MKVVRPLIYYTRRLTPYMALCLLAAPLAVVEPLKLAAVFICGSGHWVTGLIVMLCAYALSVFLVERLFKIVKPKLLKLPWFAEAWRWIVEVRERASRSLRSRWLACRGGIYANGQFESQAITPAGSDRGRITRRP